MAMENRRIDIHTHILPDQLPNYKEKFGYGDFLRIQPCNCKIAKLYKGNNFFRDIESNCWDPETRINECNQKNVTVQVLSTVPVMFNYWAKPEDCLEISKFLNDHIADICKKYPTRFVGLGTIPMQNHDLAIQELKRCKEIGLAGVQIGSHINDLTLDHKDFFPIFETAAEIGACIFVHPWDMVGQDLMKKYWLPWLVGMPAETSLAICSFIFGGILERLPKLRVAFAHGGGSFPGTIGRIEHGFMVRPDLVAIDNKINPREYCGKFWVDSLVHDPVALQTIVDLFSDSKVVLGSDYPFPLGEDSPGKMIMEMNWDTEKKDKILWKNAIEWLGIDESILLNK